jgi:lactate dehydrogenase-like 2-hydroxyacid dehydrogenase
LVVGGVGMDNIDVDYAKQLQVINTNIIKSVAELVFAIYFLACVSCMIQTEQCL